MFKKFVFATGLLEFPLGLAVAVPAIMGLDASYFILPIMIGSFLFFCGACLIWASRNIPERAPVVFWQGIVRLTAVLTILLGIHYGLVSTDNLPAAIMDLVIGPIYIVGVLRVLRLPLQKILMGQTS